ncbi:three-Cys-motif partner protein TcmP [Streptomyces sp. NRRL WC-3742]|uniref:three-Cys-motif partner protein TcmP n=1 Tax=Streptomyces sp. NRRL WC-3742 TaxID=1463934 RepID=UPI00099D8AE6|nr:three-Cys-motif partner protein TcmP [Streptomyces sp. NRRL WC-3742]
MSKGTSGEYWSAPALPSRFKHDLLSRYIPKFGGMTGSPGGQVVYLDGYAGEGRYLNGEPGSADRVLKVAADHQKKGAVWWTCFFAEKSAESFTHLEALVGEYRAQGVDARAFHGDVLGQMDEVLLAAEGKPLFLFLDPCGLALPFERLVDVLAGRRSTGAWPPTELLLNFSMMAVRRIGGNSQSAKGNERTNERLDAVCGGSWWRKHFADGYTRDADERVAAEYSRRLGRRTGMRMVSVPVTKGPGQKAVYNLVFGTRSNHGLWVFGDAHARARDTWWQELVVQEETADDALFALASLQRPDPEKVYRQAVPVIAENIGRLLRRGRPFRLVDHTVQVFGDYYGQVPENVVRKAVQHLHAVGATPTDGKGSRIKNLEVRPPLRQ